MTITEVIERHENRHAECEFCDGTGWVCENHPDKSYEIGCDCGGAGMLCENKP